MKRKGQTKQTPSVFTASGALEHLAGWEKIRALRNMNGNREESEAILSQLTGKLTDLEMLTSLVNVKEREASEGIEEWRRSMLFDEPGQALDWPRDPGAELIEIYEAFRAIQKTEDKQIIQLWLSSRSYPVRFLIAFLFSNLPPAASA